MKIVFYDASCGFCTWCIAKIMKCDKKQLLYFAPLEGKTAETLLAAWKKEHPDVDSLVYVDGTHEPQFYSKAVFSIFWELGGVWTLAGLLSFLPKALLIPFDFVYRMIAKNRQKACHLADIKKREIFNTSRMLP